jgi:F-type H+-transporting ATPase subunit b
MMLAASSSHISLMPDWTFFVQLLMFFCAYGVLRFLVFKPLLKLYAIRKKLTVDAEQRARDSENEALRLELEAKQKLIEALNELQKERDKKISEAMQKAENIVVDAKTKSKDISKKARDDALTQKIKASEKIPDELRGIVDEIKSKVLS